MDAPSAIFPASWMDLGLDELLKRQIIYGQVKQSEKKVCGDRERTVIHVKRRDSETLCQFLVPLTFCPVPARGDIVRFSLQSEDFSELSVEEAVEPSVLKYCRYWTDAEVTVTDPRIPGGPTSYFQGETTEPEQQTFLVFNNSMWCPESLMRYKGFSWRKGERFIVCCVENHRSIYAWRVYDVVKRFELSSVIAPPPDDQHVTCYPEKLDFGLMLLGQKETKTLTIWKVDEQVIRVLDTVRVVGCPPDRFGYLQISEPYWAEALEGQKPCLYPASSFHDGIDWNQPIRSLTEVSIDIQFFACLPGTWNVELVLTFNSCCDFVCPVHVEVLQADGTASTDTFADPEWSLLQLKKSALSLDRLRLHQLTKRMIPLTWIPYSAVRARPANGIPSDLWNLLGENPFLSDIAALVTEAELDEALCPDNYKERMHSMLFVEEYAEIVSLRNCDRIVTERIERLSSRVYRIPYDVITESQAVLLNQDARVVLVFTKCVCGVVQTIKVTGVVKTEKFTEPTCLIVDMDEELPNSNDASIIRTELIFRLDRTCLIRAHHAIDSVNKSCLEFLFPDMEATHERLLVCVGRKKFVNSSLNEEQKNAVSIICSGSYHPLIHVLFGPPGTGKSSTLVEAILQIIRRDPAARLLVCTPNNAAADYLCTLLTESNKVSNALTRLLAESRGRAWELVPEVIRPYCQIGPERKLTAQHRIVITTCYSAILADQQYFTHVIVDEAACATEPEVLIPITMALSVSDGFPVKILLAGDPKQLGPFARSDFAKASGFEVSLMERLMQNSSYKSEQMQSVVATDLRVNYRLPKPLLTIPSHLFYDGLLRTAVKTERSSSRHLMEGKTLYGCTFWATAGREARELDSFSVFNHLQAVEVGELVTMVKSVGVALSDIGVITQYRLQVSEIQNVLETRYGLERGQPGVCTVDEFQGREKPYIILSTVRSRKGHLSTAKEVLGFINHPKRINLALTRAQRGLMIVGDPVALMKDRYWRAILRYLKHRNRCFGADFTLPPGQRELSCETGTPNEDSDMRNWRARSFSRWDLSRRASTDSFLEDIRCESLHHLINVVCIWGAAAIFVLCCTFCWSFWL